MVSNKRLAQWLLTVGAAGATIPMSTHRAVAQAARGEIAVRGGTGTDQRGIHSSAVSVTPSILYAPDDRLSVSVSGMVTQFGTTVRPYGGSAMVGTRVPLGSIVALAATAGASTIHTSFDATYGSVDITPTLEATVERLTVYAGAHALAGNSTVRTAASTPGGVLGSAAPGTRDVSNSRTSTGPVVGALLSSTGPMAASVGYREERARVTGVSVVDRVATATAGSRLLALSASAGWRSAPDEHLGFGSVSATVSLGRAAGREGAVGSDPSNRVTGTVGGRFASVGIVLHGSRPLASAVDGPPLVRGAVPLPRGATRLAITAPDARRVELAGDWNEWTPVLATRTPDGAWYADVRVAPGEHRYAFRIDGQRWRVPDGVDSVDDGFGGRSALVTVR